MKEVPLPNELQDTECILPAMKMTDHPSVLMLTEHVFTLLKTIWHDHLENNYLLSIEKSGNLKKVRASTLLDGFAPLSSGSALMKICFVHGIIDEQCYAALEIIRSIRNSFAHSRIPLSLKDPSFKPKLERLASIAIPTINLPQGPMTLMVRNSNGQAPTQYQTHWSRVAFDLSLSVTIAKLRENHKSKSRKAKL